MRIDRHLGWRLAVTPIVFTMALAAANPGSAIAAATGRSVSTRQVALSHHNSCGTWHVTPSPAVLGTSLFAVDAVSPNEAWAVGVDNRGGLAESWNGRVWRRSWQSANIFTQISAVSALAENDVWAVGETGERPFAEHWNGRRWQSAALPKVATGKGAGFNAVKAISARNVWAVGTTARGTLIEHWNGRSWRVVPNPFESNQNDVLFSVTAAARADVWAAGSGGTNSLIEHWNGHRWRVVPISVKASLIDSEIVGITAIAPADVWAVTYYGSVLHWNGTRWRVAKTLYLGPGSSAVSDIVSNGPNNLWVAGFDERPINAYTSLGHGLAAHWNGRNWTWKRSAAPKAKGGSSLEGVAASGPATWAVGNYTNAKGHQYGLIERLQAC